LRFLEIYKRCLNHSRSVTLSTYKTDIIP